MASGLTDPPAARPAAPALVRRLGRARRTTKIAWAAAALAAVLVITLVSVAASGSAAPPRALPARNFTLPALGDPGQKVALAKYAGKPVIVNFFASWCAPCQRETPLLARFYRDSGGRILMIGIDASDETGPALKFVHQARVTYPVGTDPFPAPTTTSWGVYGLPQTFFLNSGHRIVKRVVGAVTMKELNAGVAKMSAGGRASAATAGPAASQAMYRA